MAHKYEHVSTGNGFNVINGAVKTNVISQAGVLNNATIAATSITTSQLANNAVTSAKIDTGVLQVATVALTAAQINGMYATPVVVVPAVTGKSIYVASVNFDLTGTATQFASGGVVNVQYDSTVNGAGTTAHADIAASVVTGATALVHTFRIAKDLSAIATASIKGIGLYISNKSGAFTTGTGTAVVTVRYYLV